MTGSLTDYFNDIKSSIEEITDENNDSRFSEIREKLVSICKKGLGVEQCGYKLWNVRLIQSELETKTAGLFKLIGYTDDHPTLWKLDSRQLIKLAKAYLLAQEKLHRGGYQFHRKLPTPSKDLKKVSEVIKILTESINFWENVFADEEAASECETVYLNAPITEADNGIDEPAATVIEYSCGEENIGEGEMLDNGDDNVAAAIHPEFPPVTPDQRTLTLLFIQFQSNNSNYHAQRVSYLIIVLTFKCSTMNERLDQIDQQINLFQPQFNRSFVSKIKHRIYWFFWAESNYQSENWGASHESDDLLDRLNELKQDIHNHSSTI